MNTSTTTSPRGPWTGTATPVSPISSSPSVTAQPRERVRRPSRASASGSVMVFSVSAARGPGGIGSASHA